MVFNYYKDDNGIVTLTMDMEGKRANIINEEFQKDFSAKSKMIVEDESVTGVIITSGKDTFLAGADIDGMFEMETAQEYFDAAESFKADMRAIETKGIPTVAAINGTALGGGFEMALACHHRICLNNPKIRLGLPEVSLGLLPGGGGITRMVRLLGLQAAFPYLTEGRKVKVEQALEDGIIDETADSMEELLTKALEFVKANPRSAQPWDQRGYRMPGGRPTNPKVAQMIPVAPAMLAKKTYNNYPAPKAILSAAVEGALLDFDAASRIESRYFAHLATSKEAKNMINAFWKELNKINAGNSRPDGFEKTKFTKVGVIGAGMMGAGIAFVSAKAGLEVVLKDVSVENAEKGKDYSRKIVKKGVSRGKITQEKADAILANIHPTGNPADFEGCDIVIEAVFENRDLKAKVTAEAESNMQASGIFCSNTSTLPITGLAERSSRPNQYIGLHFFSPVDKMPLVEIIVGKETSDETLAKAFDFVKQIKKTPIVVNDSRGFYTSRVFATYVLEGMALLHEGHHPRAIEMAGLQAGMPVGPLALTDEVSLSLIHHIRQQTIEDFKQAGGEAPYHPAYHVVDKMMDELKRSGKAAGAGFYEYPKDEKKHLWSELQSHFPANGKELCSIEEMKDRLMFIQSIETIRCIEEKVVRTIPDANIGSVFGWGFAPFKGGTVQFVKDYGVEAFSERSKVLAEKHGERFVPSPKLAELI